jgi:tetrahydromethanopterin S-methyltransferase subunit H
MFRFEYEQQVLDMGGVKIGGQPGELPTVLIGSIFFAGHRIVSDPVKGIFDQNRAKQLLDSGAELSADTGNPCFIDVVADTSEALIKYMEFVAGNTDSPILVDSPSQQVRMEAVRYFKGSEVIERLIYNAIAEDYTEDEIDCLRECGIRNAIILAFSAKALKPTAKIKMLEEVLLPAAQSAGIENVIVDTGVLDVVGVSWAAASIRNVKEKLGLPAGCAPANSIYSWKKMKARGTPAFEAAASSILALVKSQGADFVFYGSINNASWVYPCMATADALMAYAGRFNNVSPSIREHPLYKIF